MTQMKFLNSKEDVYSAIRNRSREIAASMTDAQLFGSDSFYKFAEGMVSVILKPHRNFRLKVDYTDAPGTPVAYTDGQMIYLNTGNSIASKLDDLQSRFAVNMGVLFHECAHKLFLDFPSEKKATKQLLSGSLYGEEPSFTDPGAIQALEEIKQALADPGFNPVIVQLYHKLSNIISDGHDEFVMKQAFPGYVKQCIEAAGDAQFDQAIPIEELASKLDIPKFEIYFDMILTYAKLGKIKCKEETPAAKVFLDGIEQIMPNIDIALTVEDTKVKYACLTSILVFLWDYIRQLLQSQSSGSQSGSGNSNGSGQQGSGSGGSGGAGGSGDPQSDPFSGMSPEEVANALQKAMQSAQQNSAPAPQNCSHKAVKSNAAQASGSDPSAGANMQSQVIGNAADQLATQEVQSGMDKAMRDYLRKLNIPGDWGNVDVRINRHHECEHPERYAEIVRDVGPYAKNVAKAMKAALEEYSRNGTKKHLVYGSKVRSADVYRKDQKFFAKKNVPFDMPDLAIAVLCDESGSMSVDGRDDAARKAMVLLEQFASQMNIPSLFAGHRLGHGNRVVLEIYSDFTSAMAEKDRQCLADIRPSGCNHDGVPIRMVGELLARRPEQVKLFFVISDGTPNGFNNYKGEPAKKDIQKQISDLNKKGVIVYGAAIGDDEDEIQDIYGKGFLDLTDLARMPRTMVRIVKSKLGI